LINDTIISKRLREIAAAINIKHIEDNVQLYSFTVSHSLRNLNINLLIKKYSGSNSCEAVLNKFSYKIEYDSNYQINSVYIDSVYQRQFYELDENIWQKLNHLVEQSYFWRINESYEKTGLDGSILTIEGVRRFGPYRQYHKADFWSPRRNSIEKILTYLSEITNEIY